MEKTIKTETILRSLYSKSETRYILAQEWAVVIPSTVPIGCRYSKKSCGNGAAVVTVTCYSKAQVDEFMKNVNKRAKTIRKKMDGVNLDAWCKEQDAAIAAAKKAEREERAIATMLRKDGLCGIYSTISSLRIGENVGTFTARYADNNGVSVHEDYERYSSSCKYIKVTRSYTLNIKRGYHIFYIGGLLTFVKGDKVKRDGMPCEWIEQGVCISDIRTVSGYLVRGEHIEAKSLKEAKAINAEHRAMQLARLLSARKKAVRRAEQKANGTLMITFADSINAGNCRPGTMEFKHKYEEEIGHEAKSISIADLRKYGKLFGVEYYAEKTIQYALNN